MEKILKVAIATQVLSLFVLLFLILIGFSVLPLNIFSIIIFFTVLLITISFSIVLHFYFVRNLIKKYKKVRKVGLYILYYPFKLLWKQWKKYPKLIEHKYAQKWIYIIVFVSFLLIILAFSAVNLITTRNPIISIIVINLFSVSFLFLIYIILTGKIWTYESRGKVIKSKFKKNLFAALGYLSFVGYFQTYFIPNDKYARFHIIQGQLLNVLYIIIFIVETIFSLELFILKMSPPIVFVVLFFSTLVLFSIMSIYFSIRAYRGDRFELLIIGKTARKIDATLEKIWHR